MLYVKYDFLLTSRSRTVSGTKCMQARSTLVDSQQGSRKATLLLLVPLLLLLLLPLLLPLLAHVARKSI